MFRTIAPLALFASMMTAGCQDGAPASMAEAEMAIADNRFMEAREALLGWRDAHGASPENSELLASVMVALGDGYTAERYLSEIEAGQGATPEWLSLRTRSLILQGKPWQARELIDQSVWPASHSAERDYLRVWAAIEEGKIEEAIGLVDEALRQYPEHAGLHAKAARLAASQGEWEAADRHVEAALNAEPDQFDALLVRGESQIADGDLEAGLATYQAASEAYPDFAIPRANIVGLLLDMDRVEEASTALDAALRLHPDFALIRYNAARLSAIRGRWNAARDTMQGLPTEWKSTFPAAIMLEADIEAALGNHGMADMLYARVADDPRFAQQVLAKRNKLPAD